MWRRIFDKLAIYTLYFELCFILLQVSAFNHNNSQFGPLATRHILRLSKSAEMRNYMRPEVDACKDFYQYACGNWARINPAINEPKTGIFSVLSKAYDRKLLKILDAEKKTTEDGETELKVKNFYESCLQHGQSKHENREQLLGVIEEFGGMPVLKGAAWNESQFDWLETVAKILHKYGRKIILGVDISADLANNEINRLYIGQLDDLITARSNEYYYRLAVVWQLEMQKVLGLSSKQAAVVSQQITNFAKKLASGMVDSMEGLGMEDKTRLRVLDEMTENYGPAINFTQFVNIWLGHDYRLPVYEYVEEYIRNLRILVLETPPRVLANYIMWELIQEFRMDTQKTLDKQKEKCIDVTKKHFVKYLDHLIYQQLLTQEPHVIEEVSAIWQQLKLSFEDILHSSTDWIHETTKDKALEKLSAMSFVINGYVGVDFEREFGSLFISSENYFENLVSVLQLRGQNFRMKLQEPPKLEEYEMLSFTPAYAAEYNRVILPVAFMQPRFLWDDVYPKALKYGTVGYIIAHEMAHGFDDTIRKYDAKGNLNNWWDRNASAVFATRKECLRQHYGQYKFSGRLLPMSQAQGENIADNVGIRIAYAAYEMWLNKHHHTPEHLPHMAAISARQLFFISSAQLWCADLNRTWHRIVASTDVHPPEEVRVRAMLSNFEAFAETFECQLGSPMHPHRKCVIY